MTVRTRLRSRSSSVLALASLVALASGACGAPTDPVAAPVAAPLDKPVATAAAAETAVPTIRVVVTVDWEGSDLRDENLAAMEGFRARHPAVPLTHFLNAAYFTKPDADPDAVAASMARPLREGDDLGLHIHGWKRLFEASGVAFRAHPSFWGDDRGLQDDCEYDCGHEVAISGYTTDELRRVTRFSLDTLQSRGFGRATAFRTGGWVATPNVRAAVAAEGLRFDHSAVPAPFLEGELRGLPLLSMVARLWPTTTKDSQPYAISAGRGTMTEIPDNGALADYVSPEDMLSVVDAATAAARRAPGSEPVVSVGFHQETAARYARRVEAALDELDARVRSGRLVVRFGRSRDAVAAVSSTPASAGSR